MEIDHVRHPALSGGESSHAIWFSDHGEICDFCKRKVSLRLLVWYRSIAVVAATSRTIYVRQFRDPYST